MSHQSGRAVAAGCAAAATGLALLLTACTDAGGSTGDGQFRYTGATAPGHVIPAQERKAAGNASAPYLNVGGTFRLVALRGKVVVLNYWTSGCGPCHTETPGLQRTYMATKADGVVVGVDVKDDKGAARSFVRHAGVTYPIVFDEIAKTALELGRVPRFALPSTVIIDRQGKVAAVYAGMVLQEDVQPVVTALAKN